MNLLAYFIPCTQEQFISCSPHIGLLDNYYDACMGWLKTPQRTNSFNFTKMFTPASDIAIVINEKYFKGDQHNLTGRTAGKISYRINRLKGGLVYVR